MTGNYGFPGDGNNCDPRVSGKNLVRGVEHLWYLSLTSLGITTTLKSVYTWCALLALQVIASVFLSLAHF